MDSLISKPVDIQMNSTHFGRSNNTFVHEPGSRKRCLQIGGNVHQAIIYLYIYMYICIIVYTPRACKCP